MPIRSIACGRDARLDVALVNVARVVRRGGEHADGATDMVAERMAITISPFRPTGNASRTKVVRMPAPTRDPGRGLRAASPSQATASAIGRISTIASRAPLRAAAASRAAKLREKLSIADEEAEHHRDHQCRDPVPALRAEIVVRGGQCGVHVGPAARVRNRDGNADRDDAEQHERDLHPVRVGDGEVAADRGVEDHDGAAKQQRRAVIPAEQHLEDRGASRELPGRSRRCMRAPS